MLVMILYRIVGPLAYSSTLPPPPDSIAGRRILVRIVGLRDCTTLSLVAIECRASEAWEAERP